MHTKERADDWDLRCRYNQARYFERWRGGEFHTEYGEPGPASPNAGQPPNTISQMAYYYDRETNDEIAKVHFYLLENGQIGASGKHDPKRVLIGSVQYRQKRGPDINRDPSMEFIDPIECGFYKFCRRLCCAFGHPAGCVASDLGTKLLRLRSA